MTFKATGSDKQIVAREKLARQKKRDAGEVQAREWRTLEFDRPMLEALRRAEQIKVLPSRMV